MNVVEIKAKGRLQGGYYTVAEAARLLRMDRSKHPTIKNWLGGNASEAGAVIARQYPDSPTELGFYDLIEVRFVDYFRRYNVSLQSIRKAAIKAREELDVRHPFAMSDVKYVTDRKRIFRHTAEVTGDVQLIDLIDGQYQMYDIIEGYLAKGVEFRPDGLAKAWRPDAAKYPKILISPKRAHGKPVIAPANVPTRALFDLWLAEKQDVAAVADWYEVAESDVEQAVNYELELAA